MNKYNIKNKIEKMKCLNCERKIKNKPVTLTTDYEYWGTKTHNFCCEGCKENYVNWTHFNATLGKGCICSNILTDDMVIKK